MEDLTIHSTKNTPEIKAEVKNGEATVMVSGNSFPENAQKFYNGLIAWLKGCENLNSIKFTCDFNYLASSSLICFLDVLRTADKLIGTDQCEIDWKFESDDDDMMKVGQNYSKVLAVKINLLPY